MVYKIGVNTRVIWNKRLWITDAVKEETANLFEFKTNFIVEPVRGPEMFHNFFFFNQEE